MRTPQCRPAFFSPALQMWVVTRHDDAVAVLSDPQTYSSALAYQGEPADAALTQEARTVLESVVPGATLHLTRADPPDHRRLRHVLDPHFSRAAVTRFEPTLRAIADELIDGFIDRKEVEIMHAFAGELPVRAIARLIGVPDEDLPRIRTWYRDWIELSLMMMAPERQLACARSVAALHLYLGALIERRRREPVGDLASALAATSSKEDITAPERVNILAQLFATGTETTAAAFGTLLARLLATRERWQRVRNADDRAKIIEEALRCNQSMRGLLRVCTKDSRLTDANIPAGARIYVANALANRDPIAFEDPDRFAMDREWGRRHLAFGMGLHHCLGASLARAELAVALEKLHDRLPGLEAVPGGLQMQTAPLVRSVRALRVRWT